jgi:Legume lectin domain/HYR domain
MKPMILRNLSCRLPALCFLLAALNLPALTYTNFSSTNGLSLVGASAVVGGALRLTPAATAQVGTAWAQAKQPCASGFDTSFQLRFSNPGSFPGTPLGGDGIAFTLQAIGPTDPTFYANTSAADGSVGVFFNTFWNWPDSTDFSMWDVSGNSVGVVSNGLYLAQTDLNPRGVNLKDGAVHNARIAFDGTGLTVWLDGTVVLTNVPVPGLASAVDAAGNAWVGFGAGTGWAWENHDILSWSFSGPALNHPPVAQCANVIVSPGANCQANASINNGSFDPDGDPITLRQEPPGPYPLGTNRVTLIVTDDKGASNSCSALVIVRHDLPAISYSNFNSTNGLNLLGTAAVVGGALRLTPAADTVNGEVWAIAKQPCAGGFETSYGFRITDPGARPGTPPGSDGVIFTVQNIGPADPNLYDLGSPADGSVSVIFNTWRNWMDCTDYTHCDVSANSVGVLSNGLYLAQADLTPWGLNLKDGAVHNARIAFDGTALTVWLDGLMVLTNVPVPGMASAVDASGNAWVGFGAGTGWAWENHDLLNWSFLGSSLNRAPVAQCTDVIVSADANCQADASINHNSFDPDGDPITLRQEPPGPYPLGTNRVTLIVTDDKCAASSCTALVIVQDRTPPALVGAPNKQVEYGTAWSFDTPSATDNCGPATVSVLSTVTNALCGGAFAATRTWQAVDASGNLATCSQTVTVADTTPPIIVCPASMAVEFQDERGAVVPYVVTASDTCSSVTLVVTPVSGSRLPIGVTPVLAQAADGCSNRAQCSFTVTVLGAQGAMSNVLTKLKALRAGTAMSQPFAQKFDESIRHLADALTPSYWINQTHLQPRGGNTAMNEEKLAAKTLGDILDAKGCPVDPTVLQGFVDCIVRCDRLLAIISIDDAARAGMNPNKVAQDLATVAKGDDEAIQGHYANAIEQYRNAWRHALQLQLRVAHNPDGTTSVQFVGNNGQRYRVEVSTDMLNWTPLGGCTADGDGNVEFTDSGAANQPMRFYRAVEE